MELREIIYHDRTRNKIAVFPSQADTDITFICLPAMGVRASYYESFATHLCSAGFNVVTADWRGQGHSSVRASRTTDFGYEQMIGDVKELAAYATDWFPATRKVIIGHSLGGQIGSLFAARYQDLVSGLILVTACSVYYKGWSTSTSYKLRFAGSVFHPVSKIVGYFPGFKIGFGGRESRTVMKDWSRNALSGNYVLTNSTYNYEEALQNLAKPVLSISLENDRLASKHAVENLYKKFGSQSTVSHRHLNSSETNVLPLTHFSWAKHPDYFANMIKEWTHHNLLK